MKVQKAPRVAKVRTKQRCMTSCGPGVPKPLNPKHVNYPASAQSAYERLERSVDRAAAVLTDLRGDTTGPEHRAAQSFTRKGDNGGGLYELNPVDP